MSFLITRSWELFKSSRYQTKSREPQNPFLALPVEIHLNIIDELGFAGNVSAAKFALRQTCSYFRQLVPVQSHDAIFHKRGYEFWRRRPDDPPYLDPGCCPPSFLDYYDIRNVHFAVFCSNCQRYIEQCVSRCSICKTEFPPLADQDAWVEQRLSEGIPGVTADEWRKMGAEEQSRAMSKRRQPADEHNHPAASRAKPWPYITKLKSGLLAITRRPKDSVGQF